MATKVKFLKKPNAKNAILFTGLPGIGLVGKICVDYMLKQFKPEKIAEIISDSFPPSVHTKFSLVNLIKDEVYYCKIKGNNYLFLAGPVQPSLDMRLGFGSEHYDFAEEIVKAAKTMKVKEVYTLAGINVGERRINKEPKVIMAATNKKILAELKKLGAVEGGEDGLISGAAGLILGIAKEEGIEGACLMGETNARLVYGDHGAAKSVLELLIKKFKFPLDLKEIEKDSREIEKAFKQLSKQLVEEPRAEPAPESGLSYVR